MSKLNFLKIGFFVLFGLGSLLAQEAIQFKVYGTVFNTNKEAVPDWTILVESDFTTPAKVVTDKNGFYSYVLKLPKDKSAIVRLSTTDPCSRTPLEAKLKAFDGSTLQDFIICALKSNPDACDVGYTFNSLGDRAFEFYTRTPSNVALKFAWNFGDGNTAEGDRTKHRYEKDGIYEVILRVKGPNCEKEYRFKVEVKSNTTPPNQSVGASCCGKVNISPLGVSTSAAPFTYIFAVGADFRYKTVEWNFGDGETLSSPDAQVKHTYKLPGKYLVKALIVGEQCKIELSVWVIIDGKVNPDTCNIDFVFKTDKLDAAFQLTSRVKPDKIEWSFGDGEFSNELSPLHTYKKEGVYLVKVTISIGGKICTAEKKIEIRSGVAPPVVEIVIVETNPNPVSGDEMFVNIKSSGKFTTTLVIGDFTGNYLHKQLVELEPGLNHVLVNTSNIKPGAYLISLFYENQIVSKWRFLKI